MEIKFNNALQSVTNLVRAEKRSISLENRTELEQTTYNVAQKALNQGLSYEDALAFQHTLSDREIIS